MTLKLSYLLIILIALDYVCFAQIITNCIDLQNMQNNLSGNYTLGNDINCSATVTWNAGAGFAPIGNNNDPFTGFFNGAGHTIYNLTINRPSTNYVGLFGYVSGNAQIVQISLIGISITGASYVGGLVGYIGLTITAYTVFDYTDGLAGNNYGSITNSYAIGTVSGSTNVGGLVGYNRGAITSSYATCIVSGGNLLGGLVGINHGSITNSYAKGIVSGGNLVGGLMGINDGTVTNSYTAGIISGSGLGGLIGTGNNNGVVYSSYWDIQTTAQTISAGGIGKNTVALYHNATYLGWDFNCVWSIDEGNAMPQLILKSCPPPPTIQSQVSNCDELQLAVFLYAAEITLTQDIDCTDTATWNNGAGFYPGLLTAGSFNGLGHSIINLVINRSSLNQIGLFAETSKGAQLSNVILEGNVILGQSYVGSLVGTNGGVIINSFATGNVTGTSYIGGLVGYNTGTITNSYATGNISGLGSSPYVGTYIGGTVGGLVGYSDDNSATITQCHATGSVSGFNYVGGLVGYQVHGLIILSYATGTVTGTGSYVGGLVGMNGGSLTQTYATSSVLGSVHVGGLVGYSFNGAITNSYATGSVTGRSNVGGLLGYNGGITNSYAIGVVSGSSYIGGLVGHSSLTVSSVTSSYWDIQTSTQISSNSGQGLTTEAMQKITSFAGWDFTTTWVLSSGYSYPLLRALVTPPVLSHSLGNVTQYIGSLLEFTIPANSFTDPNGLRLTYSAELVDGSPLPAWLIFNPSTQTFAGLPLSGAQGILMIDVSVYNLPTLSISDLWQLTIPDRSPILNAPFTPQVALNGQPFQFIVPRATFFDPDGDRLQLSATLQNATSLPVWLSFNTALGIFSGTNTHRGNQWINVIANDGFGGQISALLEIITPNTAPTTTATFPNQPAVIAQPLSFTIPTQLFFDLDGDPLSYTATLFGGAKLPSWLSFNAQTLAFQGTPSAVGFLMVSVTAMDPYNATTSLNFGVSVSASSSNAPPLLAIQMLDQTATVGESLELPLPQNMFVDPEGNPLTYHATLEGGATLPNWLNFNDTSLIFSGVSPTTGSWPITVRADDGLGGFALDTFTLTITSNQKLPPLLQNPISNQVVAVGENYQFVIPSNTFIEVNNAPLSYAAMTLPNGPLPRWLHFNPNTRTFTGTPSDTDTNLYSPRITMVEVRASNEVGSAVTTFQLSVTGKSQVEILINVLIALASAASTAFAVYRNRAFLWNTLLKKKYEKETKHIALNTPFSYQFTVSSEKILRVKALNKASSKQIHKKYCKYLNWFSFNPYQELADKHKLPDWLKFQPNTLTLSGTATEPNDFYICAEGFDGRYLEAFKLRCGMLQKEQIELDQI